MTNVSGMLADLANLKRLAQLLAAEGRLHEMDNEPLDAAHSYVDVIRFGNNISRGGFIINRLVGIACEAIGNGPLSKLVPRLSPDDSRKVILDLEKIDRAEITWDEVRRGEVRFLRYQIRQQRFNPVLWVMGWWQHTQSIKRAETRHNRVVAHEHLLRAELALRCERTRNGRGPESLQELVPQYLRRVPSDPFTGRALIYRPQGTNWLLYSVGMDGVDDGGKPASRGFGVKGDIFYDSPY